MQTEEQTEPVVLDPVRCLLDELDYYHGYRKNVLTNLNNGEQHTAETTNRFRTLNLVIDRHIGEIVKELHNMYHGGNVLQ